MPDKRKHRGRHPADSKLFAPSVHATLRTAVAEFSWLLTRGYAAESALKLVGDRHGLRARQRTAVQRSACADEACARRTASLRELEGIAGQPVGIDGYNLLITIESALSGGLVLIGCDGCYRDLAGVHGTYRKVAETVPALDLILDFLTGCDIRHVDLYLDRPVANSGRLKALIAEHIEQRRERAIRPMQTEWNIELVASPDRMLQSYPGPIVSSDSVVLDGCDEWINLAARLVEARVADAWVVDLRTSD